MYFLLPETDNAFRKARYGKTFFSYNRVFQPQLECRPNGCHLPIASAWKFLFSSFIIRFYLCRNHQWLTNPSPKCWNNGHHYNLFIQFRICVIVLHLHQQSRYWIRQIIRQPCYLGFMQIDRFALYRSALDGVGDSSVIERTQNAYAIAMFYTNLIDTHVHIYSEMKSRNVVHLGEQNWIACRNNGNRSMLTW